jgi:hypothetical protein
MQKHAELPCRGNTLNQSQVENCISPWLGALHIVTGFRQKAEVI